MATLNPLDNALFQLICESPDIHSPCHVTELSEQARDYDTTFKFTDANGEKHEAWLPLLAIQYLVPWYLPSIAAMTDYPDMAMAGDWSAIRDTDTKKLWAIFEKHILLIS